VWTCLGTFDSSQLETGIEPELAIASDVFPARKPGSAYFVQHKTDKKGQRISYHYRNLSN
jgi:hypothetical protein